MRNTILSLALAASVMVGTSACEIPTPCENLSVSQQDLDAAANGYEVEKVDAQGNECELSQDGSSWSVDE